MNKIIIALLLSLVLSSCATKPKKVKPLSDLKNKSTFLRLTHGMPPVQKIRRGYSTSQPNWNSLPLSSGDVLRIDVTEGEQFSGVFQIGLDGYLQLPFLKPIKALGRSTRTLESKIKHALIQQGYLIDGVADISVRTKQWAAISIKVRGAVFSTGQVTINSRGTKEKNFETISITGDNAQKRFLSYALKAASGVTPYADMKNIIVNRHGTIRRYDLSGIFTGYTIEDVPLTQGDEVIVPTLNHIQKQYARPSRITPPGFKIIVSNLTTPVLAKSIGETYISLPYGSNLVHAAQIAGCTGGGVNSQNRNVMLIRKDLRTGVIHKPITQTTKHLFTHLNSPQYNPILNAQDSVVCFDSNITNLREVFKLIADLLLPISLGRNL